MKPIIYLLLSALLLTPITAFAITDAELTAKHVRLNIKKGNEAYHKGDYKAAEEFYLNALQEDPQSDVASFNYALALVRLGEGTRDKDDNKNLPTDSLATKYFTQVIGTSNNQQLVNNSYFNLGNLAFHNKNYQESIDMYKQILRRDPANIKARQNLRIAQFYLEKDKQSNNQQQQNQQQQQQNQQQQDQQQQDQQKKDQQQNASQNGSKTGGKPTSGQPQMSDEMADKILNSAAKQEERTRKKVERQKEDRTTRRITLHPW